MVALEIRKIGNELGVVLPDDVLAHLSAEAGSTVFVSTQPDGLITLSCHDPKVTDQIDKAKEIMGRYRNTLHQLAQ